MEPEDDVILDTYTALRSALPTLPHLTVISIARAPSSRDTSKEVEVWAWHLLKTSLARTRLRRTARRGVSSAGALSALSMAIPLTDALPLAASCDEGHHSTPQQCYLLPATSLSSTTFPSLRRPSQRSTSLPCQPPPLALQNFSPSLRLTTTPSLPPSSTPTSQQPPHLVFHSLTSAAPPDPRLPLCLLGPASSMPDLVLPLSVSLRSQATARDSERRGICGELVRWT